MPEKWFNNSFVVATKPFLSIFIDAYDDRLVAQGSSLLPANSCPLPPKTDSALRISLDSA